MVYATIVEMSMEDIIHHVKNGDGQWYEIYDTRVIRLSNPSSIVSAKAYCLFYRKKSAV